MIFRQAVFVEDPARLRLGPLMHDAAFGDGFELVWRSSVGFRRPIGIR